MADGDGDMTTNKPTPSARPKETVSRLREPSTDISRHVATSPIINGTLLRSVQLSAEFTDVAHPLGREPVGAFVVNASDVVNIARSFDVEKPSRIIRLKASAAATLDIWVF